MPEAQAGTEHARAISADQVLIWFVAHELPPGVVGLLLGTIFGCTISVFSAGLSSATACLVVDLLPLCRGGAAVPQQRVVLLSKAISVAVGSVAVLAGLVAGLLGTELITICNSVLGLTMGPALGTFLLGMLSTRANHRGALCGVGVGLALMAAIAPAQLLCWGSGNSTSTQLPPVSTAPSPLSSCSDGWLGATAISPYWCCTLLGLTTMAVGYASSLLWRAPPPRKLIGLTLWTRFERHGPAPAAADLADLASGEGAVGAGAGSAWGGRARESTGESTR